MSKVTEYRYVPLADYDALESARQVQDAALSCLRNDIKELAKDRDALRAELDILRAENEVLRKELEAANKRVEFCKEQAGEGCYVDHDCPALFACTAIISELTTDEEVDATIVKEKS